MSTILEQTKQQSITIRVVFDGAPYAGKTTAAYSLSDALGSAATTPADDEGRTVWFDWLAYNGGHHDGKAIRVELVTVPGQDHLSARRRHLLEWGDVVVFIADTSEQAFAASVARFEELRSDPATSTMPIVVVANKRDLDDALPLETIRSGLGLSTSDPLVEGVATSGGGIREAFIHAVRVALESPTARHTTSSDELLAEMRTALTPASLLPGFQDAPPSVHDDPFTAPNSSAPREAEVSVVDLDELPPPPAPPTTELDELDELDTADGVDALPPAVQAELDALEADLEEPSPVAADVQVSEPESPPDIWLRNARLNRSGIEDDAAIVILAEHWQMLVDVANGRTELPLSDGSNDADVAVELASWGLIIGVDSAPAEAGAEPSNERYRELRDLRRTTLQT